MNLATQNSLLSSLDSGRLLQILQEGEATLSKRSQQKSLKGSLSQFIRKAFESVDPGASYLHNWHIDLIAEYLEAATRRDIKRLIINIPPGYLKSISVNVAWPAWLLGNNPSERIVSASYSDALSLKHSVDCRLVTQTEWFKELYPDFQLTADQNTKTKFMSTARGFRFATSVGGTVTGDGGNFLLVDDPLNPVQAASDTERKSANVWFDQTFSNRLRDKKNGVIVVIMQRLHEDDLTGHLLRKGGWEHISLPLIAEQDERFEINGKTFIRGKGELLHPEREGMMEVERQKTELGSYAFSAQMQQRPAPDGGGIFKMEWFVRYDHKPPKETVLRIVHSWDTAFKKDQHNDPSCCTVWHETPSGYYLVDVKTGRWEYPEVKRHILNLAARDTPDAILIEDKASGQSLIQDIRSETTLPVIAIEPEADKETRARAQAATVEARNVFLPKHADWLVDFEREISLFPAATHDDQVDSMVQFLRWAKERANPNKFAQDLLEFYN